MERSLMRMDLNLLKALHILLKERNVSRAAERLFVTPSAMSKTLHRLRDAFGDPLLVRTSSGLVPTPRAEQLAVQLQMAFAQLENCLVQPGFDPAQASGRLRIATPENFSTGLLPDFLAALHASASGLHIESLHLEDDYLESLADGALDFVIYLDQEYPDEFTAHGLFSATPRIWARRGHPITQIESLTVRDICNYPIVVFHSPSIKLTEMRAIVKALEQADLSRDVVVETSHLMVALLMLSQSDALMVAPDYLFQHRMFERELISLAVDHIPLFDKLRIDVCLIQHQRTTNSPLHQWALAQATKVVNQVRVDAGPACSTPKRKHMRAV